MRHGSVLGVQQHQGQCPGHTLPGQAGAPALQSLAPAGNAPENTIVRFRAATYPGYMTTRQAPKRPGYMNPTSRLLAALNGGVVAG